MSLVCITQSAKHFTFLKMPEIFLLLFSFEGAILHKDSAEQIFIGEAEARRRNGITSSADNEAYGNLIKLNPAAIAGRPTCSHPEHRS